ncbi:MAG TPA: LytTR family DNA-binding domain-containing protein [Steroidobacteraceae bacterium]
MIIFVLVNGMINMASNTDELRHMGATYLPWQPYVWEYSSACAVLAAIPGIAMFDGRLPITWSTWRINVARHLLGIVVFSVFKEGCTIVLRKLAFAAMGEHYDIESVPFGLGYSFLPDARIYLSFLVVLYVYRYVLSQLQGEARIFAEPDVGPPVDSLERPQRFLVRKLGKEFLIAANEIEWLKAQGNYVNLHVRGRDYPLRSTMSAIEALLDPGTFVRVHRSYMVNLDHLLEIEPLDTGDARLKLRDGTIVACSRTFRAALRERSVQSVNP